VNLEGKIQSRETLVKNSPEAQFSLVSEQKGNSYLIKRQESKQLVLLDDNGKQLLSNDYVDLNHVDIRYVNFGAGKVFIVITDITQNLSFVYDRSGNLITTPPIESEMTLLSYNSLDGSKIFSFYQKGLSVQKLP
jgi:hypothetical protein